MVANAQLATPSLEEVRPTLRQLYDEHVEFVWSALVRLGVPPSDADDCTQEVFLVVHKRLASFEARASIRSWVYGICLRVASNYRRNRRTRPQAHEDSEQVGATLATSEPGPEEQLSEHEARVVIEEALARLEPEQRLMIVMFEIDDLTGKEIAASLGLPIGTVHSRLSRARDAFRSAVTRVMRAPRAASAGTRRST